MVMVREMPRILGMTDGSDIVQITVALPAGSIGAWTQWGLTTMILVISKADAGTGSSNAPAFHFRFVCQYVSPSSKQTADKSSTLARKYDSASFTP